MPLGASAWPLWQMNSAREAIEAFSVDARHLQASRVQRHRLRLDETLKGLWERVTAENSAIGEDKAQALLAHLYEKVEQRLHANEYDDFAAYDRERRRVRSEFLEKAPKQAAALAVMYEFMEDEVVKVARRFVGRVTLDASDVESRNAEEAAELRLQLNDATARLRVLEEALAASKARERKAREDSALEQERHSQDLVDLGQGRSKALRDLLAKYEEAKRGKVEAELQLSHAVEKIEELTEWKQMNSSRAIWDAVEAEQQQARAEEAMTMKDMASMLEVGACTYVHKRFRVGECVCVRVGVCVHILAYIQVGGQNQRLLAAETEKICRTLLGPSTKMAPACSSVYEDESWLRLSDKCPELAQLGQTLAEQQQEMLTRLKTVRTALEGDSRCPSCHPAEGIGPAGGAVPHEGSGETATQWRGNGGSIGLSPINVIESAAAPLQRAGGTGRQQHVTPCAMNEQQWFTPAGNQHQMFVPTSMSALLTPLPPTLTTDVAAVDGDVAIGGERQDGHQDGKCPGRFTVSEEVVAWESSAIKKRAADSEVTCQPMSPEIAWELAAEPSPPADAPAGGTRDAGSVSPVAQTDIAEASSLRCEAQTDSQEAAHSSQAPDASTDNTHSRREASVRIKQAFTALQDVGAALPSTSSPCNVNEGASHGRTPASGEAAQPFPVQVSPEGGSGAHGNRTIENYGGSSRHQRPIVQMVERNSQDQQRRSSLMTRIETLERSIASVSDSVSVARTSPIPSVSSHAASTWEFVDGGRKKNMVTACRVSRAGLQVEGVGRKYTEYEVLVMLSAGQMLTLQKRFREFAQLHASLALLYPHIEQPPIAAKLFASKKWFGRFDPEFVECRRCWLDQYVSALILSPEVNQSKLLNTFLSAAVVPPPPTPVAAAAQLTK